MKRAGTALALLLAALSAGPAGAAGPATEPWRPTQADSLAMWSRQALDVLEQNADGVLGSAEASAFAQLDRIGRLYFGRLGPRRMGGAAGLVALLDSLGHRAVVRSDPLLPAFTLVQYLHPASDAGVSLCYLYWFRGIELLSQAVNLRGGVDPDLRVFWLGDEPMPYEAAILYRAGPAQGTDQLLLTFRLAPDASGWLPTQRGAPPLPLGTGGAAEWVDLPGGRIPEITVWSEVSTDPVFSICEEPSCPRLMVERRFVRHEAEGFRQVSQHPLSSPISCFVAFVQALRAGREEEALRLASRREVLTEARQLGLDRVQTPGSLRVSSSRCRICWPERLGFSVVAGGKTVAAEAVFLTDGSGWRLRSLTPRPEAEGSP